MLLLLLPLRVAGGESASIQTVFVILMENENWSSIHGSPDAPYINNVLLPTGSHCEQYYNPPWSSPQRTELPVGWRPEPTSAFGTTTIRPRTIRTRPATW